MIWNSPLRGKNFDVVTLGCRTNHYEAEAIVAMLTSRGAHFLKSGDTSISPDILVLVTCSITSVADAKTRKLIRRLRRTYPDALLVATGCYVQGKGDDEVLGLGVDVAIGNRLKSTLPDAIETWFETSLPKRSLSHRTDVSRCDLHWDALEFDRPRIHTRAFVKVQEGCSRGCSYCIVPSVRGPQISRDDEDIVREISGIVASGCREVVLTGIHLGSYRHEGTTLADLIREISAIPGLERLRLGSIEPFSIDDALLAALADSSAFCPHLHIPLQSGDDEILKKMRRGYSAADFAGTVARIRARLGDDVHLSTDLIAGFPGENEAAFERSLALLEELAFGRIHVFPFSARAGTPAAVMEGRVSREAARDRVGRAVALSAKLLAEYAESWVSRRDTVMVESIRGDNESADSIATGWTRHYLKAYFRLPREDSGEKSVGNIVEFVANRAVGGILFGDDLNAASFSPTDDGAEEAI